MGYLFLAGAIVAEVIGTTALRFTAGEGNKVVPYIVVVVGYVAAFSLLSLSLGAGVPLGIAYAIWAAIGVVLVVLISWLLFNESLTLVQIGGVLLVVGGVTMLELGGRH
ncbi:DMT family transporter [Lacisediminihabitans profunda]|uniref:QacE family quaternary ammonium compound efflux SMR transporter n=1 Tax=Lacisediminihabitans profunda TaxID=2594790 RepID=A0A5C8US62_9MICO|nr:SMR family transporter [Lacisediminihabitans profunda]TXN31365.1 QacE family quaternary ammonium compound efflux SMR transporter [Lacisediminihabitans profunda]